MINWQAIAAELRHQGLTVLDNPQQCQKLSLDYFHFSPILTAQLQDKRGDLAVFARSEANILMIASLCVKYKIPLTLRGAGTGNYGQCIPLEGGIILDLSQMNQILCLEPGRAVAEPGVKLATLDKQAQALGWEIRLAPSTYQTATLGGFIGGGSVGMGSVNYGTIGDRGNLRSARIVTLQDSPQVLTLEGDATQSLLHAYGTNGVISQVEIALAPCYPWAEAIVCFETFPMAITFADVLGNSSGIVKKQIAVHAHPIPQYFTAIAESLLPAHQAVMVILSDYDQRAFQDLVQVHQGTVTRYQPQGKGPNLLEFNWNHTTLLARAVDPSLTYLQVFYWDLDTVQKLHQKFGEEVMIHLEFLRINGRLIPAGLPLVRYTSPERLAEIMDIHRELGASIANPHAYTIEDGGNGQINPNQLALKKEVDPYGLLNPGKMKSWHS